MADYIPVVMSIFSNAINQYRIWLPSLPVHVSRFVSPNEKTYSVKQFSAICFLHLYSKRVTERKEEVANAANAFNIFNFLHKMGTSRGGFFVNLTGCV